MKGAKVRRAAAVAYRPADDAAPRVTAAGRGLVAERILETARAAGIPVREDAGLAEVLSHLDPGAEIPPETYRAVAEILAFLYRVDRDAARHR
ncbi:MAG: EscU/YscU/HrcU family type III secretion system export apparatus switch protein [Deltaproteobacteria bacterium]|nr:EscU/YscU/HrcU family type III secretion system export apparatus switch protein [Deltaproteobacteria bacterium]